MYRCGMQCLLSVFKNKFIDFIHCRFMKIFINNTRKRDLAFPCSYRIYVSLQGRFLRPTSENKPPTCSFLSIARLQSYPADRKNVTLAFGNFTTNFMIIDTAYPCAGKNILETRCSLITPARRSRSVYPKHGRRKHNIVFIIGAGQRNCSERYHP